jgi:hypothetical protein
MQDVKEEFNKDTKIPRHRCMAQVAEYMPSKYETLSSVLQILMIMMMVIITVVYRNPEKIKLKY